MKRFHLCMNVRYAIRSGDYRNWVGSAKDDDGRLLTASEILDGLFDELTKGHEVIPIGGKCDNFDWKDGCRGHQVNEPAVKPSIKPEDN